MHCSLFELVVCCVAIHFALDHVNYNGNFFIQLATSNQLSNSRTEYYPSSVFDRQFAVVQILCLSFFFTNFGFDVLIVNVSELMLSVLSFQMNGFVSALFHFRKCAKIWNIFFSFENDYYYMANQEPVNNSIWIHWNTIELKWL